MGKPYIALVVLIVVMALIVLGISAVAFIVIEEGVETEAVSTTTTSLNPSTTTSSSTSSTTSTTQAHLPTTTTAPPLRDFEADIDDGMHYLRDDIGFRFNAAADGTPYRIYLDGELKDETFKDFYTLLSAHSGMHTLVVSKKGYRNKTLSFEVDSKTYSTSPEVRRKLSMGERSKYINAGKVSLRYYGSSSCSNCRLVLPRLNKLVDDNRDCIVYEKLSAIQHPEEVLPVLLPTIVVEGTNGLRKTAGLVSMNKVKSMANSLSGCEIT